MKFILFFLIIASPVYPLSYDSAIYKAQKGNWQDAHSALNNIITHNPDNADAVYDAGVAAHNVGNKCQAATCFKRAAECSGDKNICFRAHFNAGNMYVDEKNLKAALEAYDKALAIEPDNEYARHNRDHVEQMLKEEEKKQQEDKQDQKDDQDKKDEDDQDEKQDQKNEEQNQKQNGSDQQKQNGNDQKSENGKDKQQNGKQNQKNDSSHNESLDEQTQGDCEQQKDAAQQRAEHGDNKKEEQKNSGKNEKRNNKDELDKQSQEAQSERDKKQGDDKHGTTPEQANVSEHNKSNVSPEDGQEQAIADPWLLKILNNQEMHDKAVNKQLMEAKIRQHGGKNGQQNCW